MALVNHDEEILWEKVQQGVGRLPFGTAIHMAGIVLHSVGVAHLAQHLNIVLGPLADTLGLNQLAFCLKELDLLLHFSGDIGNRCFHMVFIGHKVGGWEKDQMLYFSQVLASQTLNLPNSIDFIPEKFHTKGMLIPAGWENLHHISTNPKTAPLEVNIIALKLDIHQLIEELVSGNLLTGPQTDCRIRIFFG